MLGQSDGQGQGPQIKLEHLQASKNVECECGGVISAQDNHCMDCGKKHKKKKNENI